MSNVSEYKNNVFVMLMEDKRRALELYNAINDSNYTDENEIIINTLAGGFELTVRNDASFILDNVLSIYEHQSTYCPNMPLRSLVYFSVLIQEEYNKRDIFGASVVKIPNPQFVVFYNGVQQQPEYQEMKLSDCFIKNHKKDEKTMLELTCKVYNINAGRNKELLDKCKWLSDYMIFVDKVREYHKGRRVDDIEEDVSKAIEYCIEQDILKNFFMARGNEVINVVKVDYTFERRIELAKKESLEEGRKEGRDLLVNAINLIREGKSEDELKNEGIDSDTISLAKSLEAKK